MFTLSSLARRGQSHITPDDSSHTATSATTSFEEALQVIDERRRSRRGDRTSSRRRSPRTTVTSSNTTTDNTRMDQPPAAPATSSRRSQNTTTNITGDSSRSGSSRRRTLESLLPGASPTTSIAATNVPKDDGASPAEGAAHLPPHVRSYQQLARPVSRGGRAALPASSSSTGSDAATLRYRVQSGQPSPRFTFGGEFALVGASSSSMYHNPPPPPLPASRTSGATQPIPSSSSSSTAPPLPPQDVVYSTTTPTPTASTSTAMATVTPQSARVLLTSSTTTTTSEAYPYNLVPPPSAHPSQQAQQPTAHHRREPPPHLLSAAFEVVESERPLTDRKRKPQTSASTRGGNVGDVLSASALMASMFGQQKPLDWNLFPSTTPTAASGSSHHLSLSPTASKSAPLPQPGSNPMAMHPDTMTSHGFTTSPIASGAVSNGGAVAPLPPRPVARQKEPCHNMDLFAESSTGGGFERSPVELDALVVVRSVKAGGSGRRKNSESQPPQIGSSSGLPPARATKASTSSSRIESNGTPLSPGIGLASVVENVTSGQLYSLVSPMNTTSNAVSKENTAMASSGHRSTSSSSCREEDDDSPNQQLDFPTSPQKKQGAAAAPSNISNNSNPPLSQHLPKQSKRQGSGRAAGLPRLEDVLLFPPTAATSSATVGGDASTNSLSPPMSMATTQAPTIGGGAGSISRRRSSAKRNPFDDLTTATTTTTNRVEDDFGVDPFPMQKQKKKKIPIIIDDEWDDVWAFPNEHLSQQQHQQQQLQGSHHSASNAPPAEQLPQSVEQMLMGSSGSRVVIDGASGMPNQHAQKPRSAWSSSQQQQQLLTPHSGSAQALLLGASSTNNCGEAIVSSVSHHAPQSGKTGAATLTTTIGPKRTSSLGTAATNTKSPATALHLSATPTHQVSSSQLDDMLRFGDGVGSPMLPAPHPPVTSNTHHSNRAASEGAKVPTIPTAEPMRRSKEGSFRRSFPGAGVLGGGGVVDTLQQRSSFCSPITDDGVADDRVLSSALSPTSQRGDGDDVVSGEGSVVFPPPPPPPPPAGTSASGTGSGGRQPFARKQHT